MPYRNSEAQIICVCGNVIDGEVKQPEEKLTQPSSTTQTLPVQFAPAE
jgi:hypothetical protein